MIPWRSSVFRIGKKNDILHAAWSFYASFVVIFLFIFIDLVVSDEITEICLEYYKKMSVPCT